MQRTRAREPAQLQNSQVLIIANGESVPSLPDVLAKLSFLSTAPAIVGLIVTASLIVIIRDWRFSLAALSAQYVLAGLLLTRLIQPQVAVIKVLIGSLVCVVLYLTARLVSESSEALSLERGEAAKVLLPDFAFRFLATLFVGLAIYSLSTRYPLPELPLDVNFACYWLVSLGLLVLILREEPLKAGMGLLTLITGFELLFSVLERSLSVVGFLGIANLLIALAIAYLAPSTVLREVLGPPGELETVRVQEGPQGVAVPHSSARDPSTGPSIPRQAQDDAASGVTSGRSLSTASERVAAPEVESAAGEGAR